MAIAVDLKPFIALYFSYPILNHFLTQLSETQLYLDFKSYF